MFFFKAKQLIIVQYNFQSGNNNIYCGNKLDLFSFSPFCGDIIYCFLMNYVLLKYSLHICRNIF